MKRPVLLFGDMAVHEPPPPPLPPPRLPDPHEASITYPTWMPAPGALVLDAGPPGEGPASGTLTIQPAFALPVVLRFRTEEHRALGGQVSVYAREVSSRATWDATWPAIVTADRDVLVPQLRAAMRTPLNWTPPGDTPRVVLVRMPGPVTRAIAPGVWELRATLVEVRT